MNIEQIKEVKKLYEQAEERLKHFEHLPDAAANGLLIPVVNQLRYAGNHIFRYFADQKAEDLEKAKRHCERAVYDAYEVEIGFFLKSFQAFRAQFVDMQIQTVISDYWRWVGIHGKAQEAIARLHGHESRGEYYKSLEPHIEELKTIHGVLPGATEQLHAARNRIQKLESENRQFRAAIEKLNAEAKRSNLVGVFGVIAAVLGILAAGYFWAFPERGSQFGSDLGRYFQKTLPSPSDSKAQPMAVPASPNSLPASQSQSSDQSRESRQ